MILEAIITIVIAAGLKLMTSIDDAIWLSSLLRGEISFSKLLIHIVYLASLVFVVVFAYCIALFGENAIAYLVDSQSLFAAVSALGLMAFAFFILKNEKSDNDSVEINQKNISQKVITAMTVSMSGSVDELMVFMTAFATKSISLIPSIIGVVVAGVVVLMISSSLLKIEAVSKIISITPIWKVIFLVGFVAFIHSLYLFAKEIL